MMKMYEGFTKEQLIERKQVLEKRFAQYKAQNLKLDMSRGKPSKEQLDLANGIYQQVTDFISEDGIDC